MQHFLVRQGVLAARIPARESRLGAGVTIGTIAGLAAGLFTGSYLVGLATFGGISQGMIGLTDWVGK